MAHTHHIGTALEVEVACEGDDHGRDKLATAIQAAGIAAAKAFGTTLAEHGVRVVSSDDQKPEPNPNLN